MRVEYTVSAEELARLRGTQKGPFAAPRPPQPITPKPAAQWEPWAVKVSSWRTSADLGIGDTIHRKLGALGTAFKVVLTAIGVPCGCDERREQYNEKYPYSVLAKDKEKDYE